ncbi:hypothetical protein [Rhizobium leguminosarum]|uniref:hypothetical protein n=2 Tax=Rhizobium leguminosarum TaxID=384 RepID=UPI003D00F81B
MPAAGNGFHQQWGGEKAVDDNGFALHPVSGVGFCDRRTAGVKQPTMERHPTLDRRCSDLADAWLALQRHDARSESTRETFDILAPEIAKLKFDMRVEIEGASSTLLATCKEG